MGPLSVAAVPAVLPVTPQALSARMSVEATTVLPMSRRVAGLLIAILFDWMAGIVADHDHDAQ